MTDRRSILGLAAAAFGTALGPASAVQARQSRPSPDELRDLRDQFQVREVFAGYVRAVVRRDGAAVQAFFEPRATIRNFTNVAGDYIPGAASMKAEQMAAFVSNAYHPYHPGMWSNIVHSGEVVTVKEGKATYLAQVTYLNSYTLGPDGSALHISDLFGGQRAGQVTVTNCGSWEAELSRTPTGWKIAELRIIVDIPYVASV